MKKLLIANRGEIAVRIARTAREMGIPTVAVASEFDAGSLARPLGRRRRGGGPAPGPGQLPQPRRRSSPPPLDPGCDAVHPGYGFLSENAGFARKVAAAGLIWVGPDADAIDMMGNKSLARESAASGRRPGARRLRRPPRPRGRRRRGRPRIGYPLVVKASAGGGGRGIRFVRDEDELLARLRGGARGGRRRVFGDPTIYLERFVDTPATSRCRSSVTEATRPPRRPGLLHAATAPEGDRGGPGARPSRRSTREGSGTPPSSWPGMRLPRRRHGRVPRRRRRPRVPRSSR